jgi:alpha-L-fucosidase 2
MLAALGDWQIAYGQRSPGEETSPAKNVLWYRQPGEKWEQTLPLGNGRLGAAVFGGVDTERVIYNEDSLWSGWPEPNNDRQGAYQALVKIRKLLKGSSGLSARGG